MYGYPGYGFNVSWFKLVVLWCQIVVAVWYVRCRLWLLGGRSCGVQTMPFYIYADSTLLAVA